MATTRRQTSLGSGKEKKPAKSFTRSNTYTYTSSKRNPTPASPSTTNDTPPSPDKPVPNYLKPTLSSRSETSTPTSSSSFSSSRYLKKRDASLNRPPVVSSSPKDKLVSVRTTSFYPNTSKGGSQSARAASGDRPTRAPLKSAGSVPNSLPAKAGRRTLTLTNKGVPAKAPPKSSSKKPAPSPSPSPSAPAELDDDDVLNLSNDVEEIASIGSDADLVPFDQIEKLEPYSATGERDQPDKTADVSLSLGDQLAPPPVVTRKEDIIREQGTSSESQQNDKGSPDEDHQKEKADHGNKSSNATKEVVAATIEGVKLAPVAAPVPEEERDKGKKQSPVYNEVIKEAASQLLAKKKTKVSALVGAFETVISLQEPESS